MFNNCLRINNIICLASFLRENRKKEQKRLCDCPLGGGFYALDPQMQLKNPFVTEVCQGAGSEAGTYSSFSPSIH